MDERWTGQDGVRVFEYKTNDTTHIVELDTVHCENQSFLINNETGKCECSGMGSKERGDWEEINTIEEFVQELIDSGYEEVTEEA